MLQGEPYMQYNILLAEDDVKIQEIICDYFNSKGKGEIAVTTADDGEIAYELIYENEYDLVMLDVMMPKMDGYLLCRHIRKTSIVPIIFITAKGREDEILMGYDLGCDDYIVKPFSLAELYAKTTALLKRAKGLVLADDMVCGNISLNPSTFTVKAEGEVIELQPKQYALLKMLMSNKGMVVSRDIMLVKIWGYDYDGSDRILDNHVKKLRKALGPCGKQIKTVISKGYKIVDMS